jgi:hypothetical protein
MCAQVTGAVGWRKDSIKYKKNEVFLDIVEQARAPFGSTADTEDMISPGGCSPSGQLLELALRACLRTCRESYSFISGLSE